MSQTIESPRWQAVEQVIALNTEDHRNGTQGVVEELVAWFKATELFRKAEDETLYLRDPTAGDLQQHRTWITSLIEQGEQLVRKARGQGGIPAGAVRFTLEDVEASIASLRSDQRMWHSNTLSSAQRRELLKAVFDVEEPGA